MRKFYVSNVDELNEVEKNSGKVSYRRIIDRYISDLVICNIIDTIDEFVYDNMSNYEEEIYQFYLCNLSEFEKETLLEYGIILSYSNKLDLDILCVEHFGTSWDYVLTDVEWSTNFDECK